MYKVFIYNKQIQITSTIELARSLDSLSSVYDNEKNFSLWFEGFLKTDQKKALVFAFNPEDVLEYFRKDRHRCIKAAGGIVLNSNNAVLLIKRRGKWDLPKGKMDPGESHSQTALREVEEECGVVCEIIPNDIYVTYHTYTENDKDFLKETYWYPMVCASYGVLTPQLDEGISKVGFYELREADEKLKESFSNIKLLWRMFKADRDALKLI